MHIIIDSLDRKRAALQSIYDIRAEHCPLLFTLEPYVEAHSDPQRGIFHALCRELSRHTGYTEGEIKEFVKKEILGSRQIVIGPRLREVTCSSEYGDDGKKRDKVSYSELIDGIQRIAAGAGIAL